MELKRGLPLLVAAVVLGGCGESSGPAVATMTSAAETPTATATPTTAKSSAGGTRITVRDSAFGKIIWGPRRQAIYIFQRDRRNRTTCFGECAREWPPVYTRGRPVAGSGVRASLLGSIRRGNRRQVTYAGKPLYYYAHEGPGQVLCHNVNLNGGLWWVVGPNGRRRP